MKRLILYAAIAAGLWPQVAPAWPSDPTVNLPVCISRWDQYALSMASDGTGGAILAWEDTRFDDSGPDIYAARVCSDGTLPWRQSGVGMHIGPLESTHPRAVADGEGGAILVWYEAEPSAGGTPKDLFAQRVDGEGKVLWRVWVASGASSVSRVRAVASDGFGGVLLAWSTFEARYAIEAQRVSADGMLMWRLPGATGDAFGEADSLGIHTMLPSTPAEPGGLPQARLGIQVCTPSDRPDQVFVASDGEGGAFVSWSGNHRGAYLQHVGPTGEVSWADDGLLIDGSLNAEAMLPDGSGGTFLAFTSGMHVGRFDANGQPLWVRSLGAAGTGEMVPDGTGGLIIAWDTTLRNVGSFRSNIYAQRVSANGEIQWSGSLLCSADGPQDEPSVVADGEGGAYVGWWDGRAVEDPWSPWNDPRDIYAQHIDASGVRSWTADGIAVCTAPHDQSGVQMALSSTGGVVLAWVDERGVSADIYAQHVTRDGSLGPRFQSSSQFPAVRIRWKDPVQAEVDVYYAITRATNVVLRLYDVRGRRVLEKDLGLQRPGTRLSTLDVRDVPHGQYILTVHNGEGLASRKITVTR